MITEALTGWVLHTRIAGNRIQVTLFTKERGLLRAYTPGGRSSKRRAHLALFTPFWWVFDERPYGLYIRQAEPMSGSCQPHGAHILAGLYLNELLYHALSLDEPEYALFDAYEKTVRHLTALQTREALERVLRRFEWRLLTASGLHVSYTHEADGVSPLDADKYYVFLPASGFIVAEKGILGAHILAMFADDLASPDVLKTAKYLMRQAIDHLLEGITLHSRALYRIK